MSGFFFFFLTRPEHCWPFISSSYQASLPNVRCSLPKFDSKILIALNALQRDSNMRSPRTPAYGPFSNGSFFQWFLFCAQSQKIPAPAENPCRLQVPGLGKKMKKNAKKSKKIAFFGRISKTLAESHAIDATRHLYTLQYQVCNLSRLQMIHGSSNLALLCAPRKCVWSWPEGYRNFNR